MFSFHFSLLNRILLTVNRGLFHLRGQLLSRQFSVYSYSNLVINPRSSSYELSRQSRSELNLFPCSTRAIPGCHFAFRSVLADVMSASYSVPCPRNMLLFSEPNRKETDKLVSKHVQGILWLFFEEKKNEDSN